MKAEAPATAAPLSAADARPSLPAIEADRLARTFAGSGTLVSALADVSFRVAPGEFVSVVGPSGCGKSTLLHLICGLLRPSAGEVRIFGAPSTGLQPGRIGYVFQRDTLLPWKTALDNVALPLVLRGTPAARARAAAREWMHRIGLAGFEHHYPSQLSGGMRKRVALAMTMVYRPAIILMDEPFAALDVQTRNLMENELLALWAEARSTILFVTHDLEEAIALADRVIVLTRRPGRVKAAYPVDLPRPRDVTEVRGSEAFVATYRRIWTDLRDEVLAAHGRT
ncbi:MAG: ABC transporter ATP-binding protein [Armatimonadota bacterium]|nr:ABC transporter ATP-binding protein [Armatimonadota bacterium]MDR7486033.1 ABC transporter ATP-binding protein [Armatimonadota bacterium]MDR7532604.1 ABC transporter ATP-binding protein [Armatimonadota bacterium]MDR7536187.1 ABC transporter ATP-binding protein [Armatimonadota bacterium]